VGLAGIIRRIRGLRSRTLKIQPLGDRIIYQRDPVVERSEGGIHLADVSKVQTLKGTILAVGRAVEELSVGQRIGFGVHHGTDLPADFVPGIERLGIVREAEVWGILL